MGYLRTGYLTKAQLATLQQQAAGALAKYDSLSEELKKARV